jgi:hypothetical protein
MRYDKRTRGSWAALREDASAFQDPERKSNLVLSWNGIGADPERLVIGVPPVASIARGLPRGGPALGIVVAKISMCAQRSTYT